MKKSLKKSHQLRYTVENSKMSFSKIVASLLYPPSIITNLGNILFNIMVYYMKMLHYSM